MTRIGEEMNDDPLIALADRALEGTLTRDETRELERLLDGGLGAMQRYVQYVGLHSALRAEALDAGPGHDTYLALVAREGASRPPVEPQPRMLMAAMLALTCCTLAFAVYLIATWPRVVASVAQVSPQFSWAGEEQAPKGLVRTGDDLRVASGFLDLRFVNGAEVSVRGPAHLHVRSAKEIHLEYGQLLSHVPADAKGFTVATPDGRIVDLGTEFLVSRSAGTSTATTVRQGLIEIKSADAESKTPPKRLATSEAAVFDSGGKGWVDTPPDLDSLGVFDLKSLGFEVLSGNVALWSHPRGSFPPSHSSGKPGVHFIPERQSVRLTAPIRVLDREGRETLIPAGTVVNSYLLDGVGNMNGNWAVTASISCRGEIAGVIVNANDRWSADSQVGLPGLEYITAGNAGVEIHHRSRADGVTVSPDGHRIDVQLSAQAIEREQVRVIMILDPAGPGPGPRRPGGSQ